MPGTYRFGPVEVRPIERQVIIEGRPASLGARAFDLLLALIERRDRLVSKSELLEIVWPGLVVEENNLQVQISSLRKLLGPKAFATIPGQGYRFALPLDEPWEQGTPLAAPISNGRRTNLPVPAETLFGRDADILDLTQLVASHRLVTVLGAGGIGKTRLVQEMARGCIESYPDGVWWIDLTALSSAGRIAPAIANVMTVKLGYGDAVVQLARALAVRATLLVFDNGEHLVRDVVLLLQAMLEAAPGLHVLVASQESLKLPGEYVYRLEPLDVPPAGTLLHKARTYSAVQLLENRARSVDRHFLLTDATVGYAIDICRHLDGMALAIEMAAARIPVMGLEELSVRLDERLKLLRAPHRDVSARYQTMRATLDWSYSLLDPAEQAVLRKLSVFVGSFRLDAAQTVASDDSRDEWAALDALAALVDKSLIQVERTEPPRYRLLETTRLYARELLGEQGESADAARRHGQAMALVAEEALRAFWETPESSCVRRYEQDYDDIGTAFEHACLHGDAEVAGATGQVLTRIDLARGLYSSVRDRKAAAHPMILGASTVAQARLWSCVAFGRYIALPVVPRLTATREEVAAWRRTDDRRQLYDALCRLATVHGTSGEIPEAENILAEALQVEDPEWPPQVRVIFANNAAIVASYGEDVPRCLVRSRALLAAAELAGSARLAAVARMFLVEATFNSGDVERALELSRASVDEMRALELPLGRGNSLSTFCAISLHAGDHEAMRIAAREALPFVLQNGIGGWLYDQVALHAALSGHPAEAATLLGFSDSRYAAIEEVRRPQDKRAEARAATMIDAAIGSDEQGRLRAAGSRLGVDQAELLAREVLSTVQIPEVT